MLIILFQTYNLISSVLLFVNLIGYGLFIQYLSGLFIYVCIANTDGAGIAVQRSDRPLLTNKYIIEYMIYIYIEYILHNLCPTSPSLIHPHILASTI